MEKVPQILRQLDGQDFVQQGLAELLPLLQDQPLKERLVKHQLHLVLLDALVSLIHRRVCTDDVHACVHEILRWQSISDKHYLVVIDAMISRPPVHVVHLIQLLSLKYNGTVLVVGQLLQLQKPELTRWLLQEYYEECMRHGDLLALQNIKPTLELQQDSKWLAARRAMEQELGTHGWEIDR